MCSAVKKLSMDVDVGLYDAQGLMLDLAHPGAEIVGISVVHGKVDMIRVAQNIMRVLMLCGRTALPFYLGADESLVAAAMDAPFGALKRGRSVCQELGGKAALQANVLLVKEICLRRFRSLLDAAPD